jgi:2-keto-4-pentenoate hydratase/2-oxohepta-3-ene-1,7-dioic acid hydratase in catechol pathway
MRIANVANRAVLLIDEKHGIDIHDASLGEFGPDQASLYDAWASFSTWAEQWRSDVQTRVRSSLVTFDRAQLGPPSPRPRQIFAIGRNYHLDPADIGTPPPDVLPPTFTKFLSSLTGPDCQVQLPAGGATDWEVELVVVIGTEVCRLDEHDARSAVAGVCVGQDLSERVSQMAGAVPQFSLGKSFPNFAPTGPWLVTVDELTERDDIALGCTINGETVQEGATRSLIFSVPQLIARLSQTVTLLPGDLIFTGTPDGTGQSLTPPRFLVPGDRLRSWADGIGELHQTFTQR